MSIILSDCAVCDGETRLLQGLNWHITETDTWAITGVNGSGKSTLAAALAGRFEITPQGDGFYSNSYAPAIALVSFEAAAALIEEERQRDESEFTEGGVDPGRTPRILITEALRAPDRALYPKGDNLEAHPTVQACRLGPILDRGLKYLSTGEIRRTLLCRALAAKPALLIVDDPFGGLDTVSRETLSALFSSDKSANKWLFVLDRYDEAPALVTHVLELRDRTITFCGSRDEYERTRLMGEKDKPDDVRQDLQNAMTQTGNAHTESDEPRQDILAGMNHVTVEWSDRKVLDDLSWTLKRGEHWLIRGPNGSGKTTLLELITGDNPQVFRNDVWLFGNKRGSGETIWEIKEKLGIVSYRLHTEYRALGDVSVETVVLSGLHDSIGLYQQCGEVERELARTWLALAGLGQKAATRFRDLSYGEQRTALIARAVVKCPQILILDEPCHGLDEPSRARVLAVLQAIAETGKTTLLHVTHDPTEVLACERHILELCPGETPMYRLLSV